MEHDLESCLNRGDVVSQTDWEDIGDCWWWQIQKTLVRIDGKLVQLTGRRVMLDTEDVYNCYYEYDPVEIEEIKGEINE